MSCISFVNSTPPDMWQEPEPPSPKPIVTGFPIESLPPQKSLKDKKKTSLSNEFDSPSASSANSPAATSYTTFKSEENNSSARELACSRESIVNSDSRSISPDVESRFKIRLKTSMLDTVQQESQIRRSTRVAGQDLNYYAKAREALGISKRKRSSTPPATLLKPKDRNIKPETPVKSTILSPSTPEKSPKKHKRIKITVKTYDNAFGYGVESNNDLPSHRRQPMITSPTNDQETNVNNDFCSTCGGIGKFLCCETCPKSFHFTCVDPPLEEESLPDGEWLCTECYVKRQPPKPFKQNTLFGPLMNQLQKRNPRQFKLPKRIQERFEGVTIGPDGEYQDDIKPKKISTRDEEINFDKNGKPILCFKCGKSALNGIQMATCEFCNQSWHVDCLDSPALSVGSGWMCPNHTAQVVKLPRRPRKAKFVNTNLRRGFKNKGNIEVQDSSDEEDSDMVQDIPFFDIRNTEHGVSAPYPKQIEKMFSIDGVIYRLPARGIKLDFIDHVNQVNEDIYPETNSSDILMALDELSARPLEERRAVRDLCYLQAEGSVDVKVSVAHENIQRLLDVAFKSQELSTSETVHQLSFPKINGTMEEESSIISTGPSEVSRECVEKQILNGNSVSEQELRELFAVKRMMELTGKEKLMKFLLNETN